MLTVWPLSDRALSLSKIEQRFLSHIPFPPHRTWIHRRERHLQRSAGLNGLEQVCDRLYLRFLWLKDRSCATVPDVGIIAVPQDRNGLSRQIFELDGRNSGPGAYRTANYVVRKIRSGDLTGPTRLYFGRYWTAFSSLILILLVSLHVPLTGAPLSIVLVAYHDASLAATVWSAGMEYARRTVGIARLVSLAGTSICALGGSTIRVNCLTAGAHPAAARNAMQGSGSFSWFLLWVWGEQTFGPGIVASPDHEGIRSLPGET